MPAGAWRSYALEPAFMRDWAEKYIRAIGQSRFRDITYVRNAQVAEVRIGPTRPTMLFSSMQHATCHTSCVIARGAQRTTSTAAATAGPPRAALRVKVQHGLSSYI